MVTALLCSIAAFAVLFMATFNARQSGFYRGRTTARYLAEAGLVIASRRLMANPSYCGGLEGVDTNGDGDVTDPTDAIVTVEVTNCGAGNNHVIRGAVSY